MASMVRFRANQRSARTAASCADDHRFVDPAVKMAVDDLGERVGEIGVRNDAAELAGLD